MEFKLTIENLGNIEHATLAVKPFTIIAGENSSGKTFATKSLYCVLDAIHRDHVSHRLVLIGLRFERALSMFSTELKDPSQSDIQFMEYVESRFIEWLNALISHSHESVLFKSEAQLLQVEAILKENNILARRYFYPSLDTLDYLKPNIQHSKLNTQHSRSIASRILCLPIYPGLAQVQQNTICGIIRGQL